MKTQILSAAAAKDAGFAKFNGGDHLCVDIPDGHSTISARTSDGQLVTFAFVPYGPNEPPKCVDIQHHTTKKTVPNGNILLNVMRVICFSVGTNSFRSSEKDEKPTTLVTVLLKPEDATGS